MIKHKLSLLSVATAALFISNTAYAQMPPRFDPASSVSPANTPTTIPPGYAPDPSYQAPTGSPNYAMPSGNSYGGTSGMPVDKLSVERSQNQLNGNFGAMDRSMGIPLGMTQDAWSQPFKNMSKGQEAPGVVRFNWTSDLIMPIRIRTNMNTNIILPEWETISPQNIYSGEDQHIMFKTIKQNVVAVRTNSSGTDTTLTVVGDSGNIYTFYIRAEDHNSKVLTDIMVYVEAGNSKGSSQQQSGWMSGSNSIPYTPQNTVQTPTQPTVSQNTSLAPPVPYTPGATLSTPGTTAPQQTNGEMTVPREKAIYDMTLYEVNPGDRSIAPKTAYTDGVFTYLDFGKDAVSQQKPVIYEVVDGIESRINYDVVGKYGEVIMIQKRGNFVLRNGQKVVCIKRTG